MKITKRRVNIIYNTLSLRTNISPTKGWKNVSGRCFRTSLENSSPSLIFSGRLTHQIKNDIITFSMRNLMLNTFVLKRFDHVTPIQRDMVKKLILVVISTPGTA